MKICSRCKLEKVISDFYKNKSKKDGLQTICKECTKLNDKLRVISGKNKLRCKINYANKMNDKSYVEKERQRKLEWRKNNVETHRKLNKEHYQNNKEYYYNKVEKRRSLLEGLESNFTLDQWRMCKNHFNNKCAYCGCGEKLTQEHFIPVDKRGTFTIDNIIPACKSCNSSKCNKDFFEWYPCQSYYSQEKEQKILTYIKYNKNKQKSLA